MSLDLVEMSNDEFDDWLRDQGGRAPGDDLTEEHLVQLVGTTLRGGATRKPGKRVHRPGEPMLCNGRQDSGLPRACDQMLGGGGKHRSTPLTGGVQAGISSGAKNNLASRSR